MDRAGQPTAPQVILASASASRAAVLRAAGVPHRTIAANIDEGEIKHSLTGEGAPAAAVAETLARAKALQVSQRYRDALVIGADQVLVCNGQRFDKPVDLDHARAHLMALRGRQHTLATAVSVARDGAEIWHHSDAPVLEMRHFPDAFIDWYIDAVGAEACQSVGAYKLEGLGVQLFARINGDFFTILGLPLLPLLEVLRSHGVIER